MNLYPVTKFAPYFPFTLYCFYTKIGSFMPVLTIGIVRHCFYLLIFYSEKFSTWVRRLPFAVTVNLNLSNLSFRRGKPSSRSQHQKVPWDAGVNRKERVWRPQSNRGIKGKSLFLTSFKACYSVKAKKTFWCTDEEFWRMKSKCKV